MRSRCQSRFARASRPPQSLAAVCQLRAGVFEVANCVRGSNVASRGVAATFCTIGIGVCAQGAAVATIRVVVVH
eukprot:1457487-Lingulodinium_polyedra.AAC.1